MTKRKKKPDHMVNFRLPDDDYEALQTHAQSNGLNVSSFLRIIVLAVNDGRFVPIP